MNMRAYRTFQALVLAVLGLFLLGKLWDGTILIYINKRYVVLILLAAVGLMILAQEILRDRARQQAIAEPILAANDEDHSQTEHTGSWPGLWLLALPVILGLLIPARPLGASVVANRMVNNIVPLASRGGNVGGDSLQPDQRTILDWIWAARYSSDPAKLTGQQVDVIGFVYHDGRLRSDQMMIGRFAITCCVADALAIGMAVNWPQAAGLPDNQWVRIQGKFVLQQEGDLKVPGVSAQMVDLISEPQQPYLFP